MGPVVEAEGVLAKRCLEIAYWVLGLASVSYPDLGLLLRLGFLQLQRPAGLLPVPSPRLLPAQRGVIAKGP